MNELSAIERVTSKLVANIDPKPDFANYPLSVESSFQSVPQKNVSSIIRGCLGGGQNVTLTNRLTQADASQAWQIVVNR